MSREHGFPPYRSGYHMPRPAECMPNVEKYGCRNLNPQRSSQFRGPSDSYQSSHSRERVPRKRTSEILASLPVSKRVASNTPELHSARNAETFADRDLSKLKITFPESGTGNVGDETVDHALAETSVTQSSPNKIIEEHAPEMSRKVDHRLINPPGKTDDTVLSSDILPEPSEDYDLEIAVKYEPVDVATYFDVNVACPYDNAEETAHGLLSIDDPLLVSLKLESGSDFVLPSSTVPEVDNSGPSEPAVTGETEVSDTTERVIDGTLDSNYMMQGVDKVVDTVVPLVGSPENMEDRSRRFRLHNSSLFVPRPKGKWRNWSDEDKINAVRWFGAHPEDLTHDTLDKWGMPEPHLWPVFVDGAWKLPGTENSFAVGEDKLDNRFAEIFEWNAIGSDILPGRTSGARGTDMDKLQACCAHLELSTAGGKTNLIDRLYNHHFSTPAAAAEPRPKRTRKEKNILSPSAEDLRAMLGLAKGTTKRLMTFSFKCLKDLLRFGSNVELCIKDMDLTALFRIQHFLKTKKPVGCPECREPFVNPFRLVHHFRHKHADYAEQPLFCTMQCGYRCYTDTALRKHWKKKHPLSLKTEILTEEVPKKPEAAVSNSIHSTFPSVNG